MTTTPRSRSALLIASAVLALPLLSACSDAVSCGLDQCTVTFQRGVEASVSVLGVDAKLVSADANSVTLDINGTQLPLTAQGPAAEVAGLQVSLASINDKEMKIQIARP